MFITFCLLYLPGRGSTQILPKEGSTLNYRLIGFSAPIENPQGDYEIEIAVGSYHSVDSFKRNIALRVPCKYTKTALKTIIEVPFFGKAYTWSVVNLHNKVVKNALHHFGTLTIKEVDTSLTRLRVLKKAAKYKDAYVFLDGNRALYDMTGQPVWYLPDIDGFNTERSLLRDLKLSPAGTITFMYEEHGAYEINYNGDILWKAPNNGAVSQQGSESYHHEFTRLSNGHYMTLGSEYELWNRQLPSDTSTNYQISHFDKARKDSIDRSKVVSLPFGTVIEYNEKGDIVWSWRSSDYFRKSDIYYHKGRGNQPDIAVHENSFYFDEKAQILYVGFRNISRILKVKYPEGKVIGVYGEIYKPDAPEQGNGLFCRQHSIRYSDKGYLYMYNNNSCGHGEALPQLLKLEEPANEGGSLKKIWEYDCTIEGVADTGQRAFHQYPVGGNIIELPDYSIFANMSTTYSKVFILGEDKEILWSAIPEKWNERDKKWEMVYDYRASIITSRKDLENLVWNAEKK